ncbi:tetratricopeptide repeat protein 19, mitochondrial isoform X2 [Vanacampus margaritifer]
MAATCVQMLRRACSFGARVLRPSASILSPLGFFSAPLSRVNAVCRNAAMTSPSGGGAALTVAAVAFSPLGASEPAAAASKEDELILLLKKAKLSILRGQLEAASSYLHAAAIMAQQERHQAAIIYTYSQMANLAYVQGHLTQAEKLFKAAMSYMLAGGMPQDDNAFVEMSLKLATMYAQDNKAALAEHGFRFCLETLEAKVKTFEEKPADELTEAEEVLRKDTRLLLGLCLDSHARYLASTKRVAQAAAHYRKALDICRQEQGPQHHQTLVLMSDLATILDIQGQHDEALALIRQAVDTSRASGHEDLHVFLANMAAVLLHTGRHDDGVRAFHEALHLARQADDREAVRHILRGLERAGPGRQGAAQGAT